MIKLVFENNIQFFFIYERIKNYDYFLFKNIYNFIFILHLRNLKNKGYVCLIIGFFKERCSGGKDPFENSSLNLKSLHSGVERLQPATA